jgi:hypothetical protein
MAFPQGDVGFAPGAESLLQETLHGYRNQVTVSLPRGSHTLP